MELISSFTERLSQYREQTKQTLEELSETLGMPAQTINRYELGQRTPKVTTAIEIAQKLGINPLWLQGYDTSMFLSDSSTGDSVHENPYGDNRLPFKTMFAHDDGQLENMTDDELFDLQSKIMQIVRDRKR